MIGESFFVYISRILVSIDVRVKQNNMLQKLYTSAHIERYLRGKMSPQEERDFLLYIKHNTRFRNKALIKVLFIKQIKAYYSKVTNTHHDRHIYTDIKGKNV